MFWRCSKCDIQTDAGRDWGTSSPTICNLQVFWLKHSSQCRTKLAATLNPMRNTWMLLSAWAGRAIGNDLNGTCWDSTVRVEVSWKKPLWIGCLRFDLCFRYWTVFWDFSQLHFFLCSERFSVLHFSSTQFLYFCYTSKGSKKTVAFFAWCLVGFHPDQRAHEPALPWYNTKCFSRYMKKWKCDIQMDKHSDRHPHIYPPKGMLTMTNAK